MIPGSTLIYEGSACLKVINSYTINTGLRLPGIDIGC